MSRQVPKIRIFLCSPEDVADERSIAKRVINDLPYDPLLRGAVSFEIVAWDLPSAPGLDARLTPQQALNAGIPKPSQCDIVVGIFWSKMGTPFELNGTSYLSGSQYELEEARAGKGHILIYRREERISFYPDDPEIQQKIKQWQAVDSYFSEFTDEAGAAIGGYNRYNTPSEFGDLLLNHLKNFLVQSFAPNELDASLTPKWEHSPFPGLRSFTTADAPIFFGRGRETDALIKQVESNGFVAVVGASGSGKSSLVGSGLLPRLKSGAISGSQSWVIPEYDPEANQWVGLRFSPAELGDNPFVVLASKLCALTNADSILTAAKLLEEPWTFDAECAQLVVDGEKVVIFVDQFEEIFTLVPERYRTAFVNLLKHPSPHVRWIITMRSDFYHRCVDIPDLARLLEKGQFPLSVPTDTLLDMIARPAERALIEFEEGLTWKILEDTGHEPGSLALMAYTLDELYKISVRRGDGVMTSADYNSLGGVQGAIGKRAEDTFKALSGDAEERSENLSRVFKELVEVDERGVATKQRASLEQLTSVSSDRELIEAFVGARLLTTGEGEAGAQIEVAHEALLRSWMRLEDWINSIQTDLYLLRQLRNAAAEWAANNYENDYRWHGKRSDELQAMLARLHPNLSDVEESFARPEATSLLEELQSEETTHIRREAIGQRLLVLGDPRSGIGLRKDGLPDIEWCRVDVPADHEGSDIEFSDHEGMMFGTFRIRTFFIAKYLVTNEQFQTFLDAENGVSNQDWWADFDDAKQDVGQPNQDGANYPRDSVSWHLAVAFTRWLDDAMPQQGRPEQAKLISEGTWDIRLPTEWEWQWAAGGGDDELDFPWGQWDPSKSNLKEAGIARPISVGLYPQGSGLATQKWRAPTATGGVLWDEESGLRRSSSARRFAWC